MDFLLQKGRTLVAIEVKSSERYSNSLVRGLRAIGDLSGLSRRILLYTGSRVLRTQDNIDVLPVRAFLDLLEPGKLFP